MSIETLKNNLSENLLACRTCLATERKLYSIHEWYLAEPFKSVVGYEASPYDGLPQYVCNYCGTLLLKFNKFRRNCREVQGYLEDVKILSPDLKPDYYLTLKRSDTKIIDSTHEENIGLGLDDNEIHKFESQDYGVNNNSPYNEDTKIYTDILNIEIGDKDTTITSKMDSKPTKNNSNTKTKSKSTKTDSKLRKKGKYFETDENLRGFEMDFNVDVIILSQEQQMNDVLERKLSSNYLHSPYKCELCYKGVMDEDSLKKHMLYQHDPSRGSIVCQFCSFRYKDKRGLNQHLKSHRLKFACKQCPYVSRTTFNAKEHFKMHTGHTHKCRHCGKSYEKLSSHLTHLRIHHPSHFVWCNICGEAFIGEFGLNAHKKRAHRHLNLPFHCVACERCFVSESALSQHTSYNDCSTTICVHCGDSFDKAMQLRDHLLKKHRSCKVYECEKCKKTFSRQSLHSAHYRRAHVDSSDRRKAPRPWVCEVCGKTLPNKCVLVYHQRNHTGERPYQCTECSKSFTMKKLLQSHLRVHTTDRPYSCKVCPKTFKGLSALRTHEHMHNTGPKKMSTTNRKI